jgi:hypothetical protein
MQKIDRLGWAAGIAFVSHGARLGIRVNDPAILERLPEHLPPGWRYASSPVVDSLYSLIVGGASQNSSVRRYNLLYGGAARLARTMELDEVLQLLESSLRCSVALRARRRLFVHAGVVGWRGRAIVIPGRSMSGKTTLVEALVRAGATYYSDEYAVFDAQGRVHPYPKPLSIRQEPGKPPKRYPVEVLGGHPGTKPLPVGLIAVTRYDAGARWRPRVLSPGQALLALLDNTLLARIRPGTALATLQCVVPAALTLQGKHANAQEVIGPLLDRLMKESTPIPPADKGSISRQGAVA